MKTAYGGFESCVSETLRTKVDSNINIIRKKAYNAGRDFKSKATVNKSAIKRGSSLCMCVKIQITMTERWNKEWAIAEISLPIAAYGKTKVVYAPIFFKVMPDGGLSILINKTSVWIIWADLTLGKIAVYL